MARRNSMLNMFTKRKENHPVRNGVMLSLLGAGVGAAVYSMVKDRNNMGMAGMSTERMMEPIKESLDAFRQNMR